MPDEVLGYQRCRTCGRATPELMHQATGGLCGLCWAGSGAGKAALSIRHGDAVIKLDRPPRRVRKGNRTKAEQRRHHLLEKIKRRAMKRLRDLHQDEYARLLAVERDHAGLEPLPLSVVVAGGPSAPRPPTIGDDGAEDVHTRHP